MSNRNHRIWIYLLLKVIVCLLFSACTTIKVNYKILGTEDFDISKISEYQYEKYHGKAFKRTVFDLMYIGSGDAPVTPTTLSIGAMRRNRVPNGVAFVDATYTYRTFGLINPYFLSFSRAKIEADGILLRQ